MIKPFVGAVCVDSGQPERFVPLRLLRSCRLSIFQTHYCLGVASRFLRCDEVDEGEAGLESVQVLGQSPKAHLDEAEALLEGPEDVLTRERVLLLMRLP